MTRIVNASSLRREFRVHLLGGLRVVWHVFTVLLSLIAGLGCVVALIEQWSLFDGIYFAFVSALTIGYGDLAPQGVVARTLAIGIGFVGIHLGGLVAALGVHALHATLRVHRSD